MKGYTIPLDFILTACAEILFLKGRAVGMLMLAVTLVTPQALISGLVAVFSSYAFASLIGIRRLVTSNGFYTYNALLIGLSLGNLYSLGPISLLFGATAGVFSLLVCLALGHGFGDYLKLPVISLPFVIVSGLFYLAVEGADLSLAHARYLGNDMDVLLPIWLDGFLRSLGTILFTPDVWGGAVLALLLLWHSRIQLMLALSGYLVSVGFSALAGIPLEQAWMATGHFNSILIAIALGGVFLVPSPAAFAIAAMAVCIGVPLNWAFETLFSPYGLPVFTLPFNLVTLLFLYCLGSSSFSRMARVIESTPEKTLDYHLSLSRRSPPVAQRIRLPFTGNWTLWQGFDGPWTHQGAQRYACDFLLKVAGSSHRDDGALLEHYYAWRKPVLAPCTGTVVTVVDDIQDNPPGRVNTQHNWGNHLVIDSGCGWHAIIAHFACGGIAVVQGQRIVAGQQLGLCGNSGYSPQPHIHLHLQIGSVPGQQTLPFVFEGFVSSDEFQIYGIPTTDQQIRSLLASNRHRQAVSLVLDRVLHYRHQRPGRTERILVLQVRMNALGETYLDSGRGRLFFYQSDTTFYCYRLAGDDPALALIFTALPQVPLGDLEKMIWRDTLPQQIVRNPLWRGAVLLLQAFFPRTDTTNYRAHWSGEETIEGNVLKSGNTQRVFAHLDADDWFDRIVLGNECLERIPMTES